MRSIRGLIALTFSLLLALIVATAVYRQISKPAPAPAALPAPKAEKNPAATLSQRIDKGMRAVTLKVDEIADNTGQLAPGDRVDILAVTPIPGDIEGRVSRLLLSGARILEIANEKKAGAAKSATASVTLVVTPQEAAVLATADPAATLRLITRNPADETPTEQPVTAFSIDRGVGTYTAQTRDLSRLIEPGMRALTLEVNPTDGVASAFQPGDHVDILVTCPYGNASLEGEDQPGQTSVVRETYRNSRIMLQNIRIIATDQSLTWDSGLNQPIQRVTLAVTPTDAEKLTVLADSKKNKSTIRLITRNQQDRELARTEGVELLDLLVGRRPYLKVQVHHGSKRIDQTFYQ